MSITELRGLKYSTRTVEITRVFTKLVNELKF